MEEQVQKAILSAATLQDRKRAHLVNTLTMKSLLFVLDT